MKQLIDQSLWKFLLVGVGNTLLSMVVMFALEGLGYWPSTAIAYGVGGILSFCLNRRFTFESKAPLLPSAVKFALVLVICYLLAYSLAQPLVGFGLTWFPLEAIWAERVQKLAGMGIYTLLNYVGQRFFAFAG